VAGEMKSMGEYASVANHRTMVFDRVRNAAYRRAIEAAVQPESVVLDLGAGLGLHGLMAARAGARKVYLVEPEPILEVTRQVVADNGFDNVELIAARGEDLELPEKVDLIISVFTGNFLLTEDLLPALFAARDRCLRAGGRLIPDVVEMRVAPVSAPAYHRKMVACWAPDAPELEGLDYSAARRYAANTAYYDGADNIEPELLAPATTLMELDLLTADRAACNHSCELAVSMNSTCHGWLGWFRMKLCGEWLSTSPRAEAMHWSQVLLPLDPPLALSEGEKLGLELQRPPYGDWVWKTRTADHRQQASTFFSEPPALDKLHKRADHYEPRAGDSAQAAVYALSRFNGQASSAAIASEVFSRWPRVFRDVEEALGFVRRLAEQFG
jgi:SAM-dependent methyltransferase